MRYAYDTPDNRELLADLQRYYDTVMHGIPNNRKVLGLRNFFGPKPEGKPHAFFIVEGVAYGEPTWSYDLYKWLLAEGYEFNDAKLPRDVQRLLRERGAVVRNNRAIGMYPIKRGTTR